MQINVMRTFLNRFRDRGWKNINLRGYTDTDNQLLRRGDTSVIGVETIKIDASGDIRPQIDELFNTLIEIIKRSGAKVVFLPGGGDIPIPDFFEDFCREHDIRIHLVTLESYRDDEKFN